jgi:hypothetical protein
MYFSIKRVLVCFLAFNIVGCASVMNGSSQNIGISSTPTGAKVTIDNKPAGVTPLVTDLNRKEGHVVSIEMPGYKPVGVTLSKGTSAWVWGNLFFLPAAFIGLGIDYVNGGMYKLSPEQVNVDLDKGVVVPIQ